MLLISASLTYVVDDFRLTQDVRKLTQVHKISLKKKKKTTISNLAELSMMTPRRITVLITLNKQKKIISQKREVREKETLKKVARCIGLR